MPKPQAGFAHILLILILLAGIGLAVYLTQFTQIFRPHASVDEGTCQASDVVGFKKCLSSAETSSEIKQIEITKQIICHSVDECKYNRPDFGTGPTVGFLLSKRNLPLTIFGTPNSGAGFKRVDNYDYSLMVIGDMEHSNQSAVTNITLKNLIFDETTAVCDETVVRTGGINNCDSTIVLLANRYATLDQITILHSKHHAIQADRAFGLTVKNSIIYDSNSDGMWFVAGYKGGIANCEDVRTCPTDINTVSSIVTIENNLIANSRVSALEFTGYGNAQYHNIIKGNLFVHNHRDAKYIFCPPPSTGVVGGHCGGGQLALTRSQWADVEDNTIRDGFIDGNKPKDPYEPNPYIAGETPEPYVQQTYEELGRHSTGIELSSLIDNITIRNNKVYNNTGGGIFADYSGSRFLVGPVNIAENTLYGNGLNFGKKLEIDRGVIYQPSTGDLGTNSDGITIEDNNIIDNSSRAIKLPKAFVFADPPICYPNRGEGCDTKIRWYSEDYSNIDVGIKADLGTSLGKTADGATAVPWLSTAGGFFEIRSGNQILGSVFASQYSDKPLTIGTETRSKPPIATIPSATITANPNPCTLKPDGRCTTTITWSSQNAPDLEIRVSGNTFGRAPEGSQEVTWITAGGATFEAYTGSSTTPLASLTVKGVSVSGQISASPTTCTIAAGQSACTSKISWSVANPQGNVQVRVREGGGLFGQAASGSQDAPWIHSGGAHFDLYDGDNLLQTAVVQVVSQPTEPSPSPVTHQDILSASPNPCTLKPGGLCTSKISWNSSYSDLKITIRESPGSVFAQTPSGAQDAPWITASGATFDAYSDGSLVDSIFVKGTP